MKPLLAVTAVIEAATGIGLLITPSIVTQLLLGGTLDGPVAQTVARVGGAALIAIGFACWRSRENGRALVIAMLLYNTVVAGVLIHAAVRLGLSGIGLWPTVALHLGFAVWCMVCLRPTPTQPR
jgi:hypothetical protein